MTSPFHPSTHPQLRVIESLPGSLSADFSAYTTDDSPDAWNIQSIARILLARWRLILAAAAGSGLIALVYLMFATRLFTATSTIEISGYAPVLPGLQIESVLAQQSKDQNYMKTQVAKLKRLSVADRVLSSDPELTSELEQYFADHRGLLGTVLTPVRRLLGSASKGEPEESRYRHSRELLMDYLALVGVSPVYGTSLVEVSVTTAEPSLSRKLADLHAHGFIEHLREERQRHMQEKLSFLKTEGEELERRVADAERRLALYAEENELLSLSDHENVEIKEISELTRLLSEATSRRIQSESVLKEIEGRPLESTDALDNQAIRDLVVSLSVTEAEYADLGKKVTPLYPRMQQLRARIDSLKEAIRGQREQAKRSLEATYESNLQAETQLKAQIEAAKDRAHDVSKRLVQYNILKREYESLKDLHQSVLRQRKETQITSSHQGTDVLITDFAALPQGPSAPRSALVLLFALTLGGSIGVGVAVFQELFRTTLNTAADVTNWIGLPALASIPQFSSTQHALPSLDQPAALPFRQSEASPPEAEAQSVSPIARSRMLVGRKPAPSSPKEAALSFFRASEAFRTLRTFILLSSPEAPPKTLLITSASKGEGKTTVASNLAVSFSKNEKRVLLIDADVRQPNVHRRFGIEVGRAGLVDYLVGMARLDEVVVPYSEHLAVIPAGSLAPSPAELLGSQRMRALLDEVQERFDFILIDSPPVLPVADTLVLSPLVEKVMVVARSGQTRRHLAQETIRRLRGVRAAVLGVVLNDSEEKSDPYGQFRRREESTYYVMPDWTVEEGRRVVGQD